MNEKDYQKVFEHFTDLSQRYALGKIQHETLRDGLRKLIGEIIQAEIGTQLRRTRLFYLALGLFIGGSAGAGYYLWKQGIFQPAQPTAQPTLEKQPHKK